MDSYRLGTLSSLLDAWVIPHCSPGHLTHPKGPKSSLRPTKAAGNEVLIPSEIHHTVCKDQASQGCIPRW